MMLLNSREKRGQALYDVAEFKGVIVPLGEWEKDPALNICFMNGTAVGVHTLKIPFNFS